jgi:hypothetical protein
MAMFPTSVIKNELGLSDSNKPADPLLGPPAAVEPVEQAAQPITPLFDREELKELSPIEKQRAALRSSPPPEIDLPSRVPPIGRAQGVTLQPAAGTIIVPEPAPDQPRQFTVDGVPFTVDTGEITTQDYMDRIIDSEVRGGIRDSVVGQEMLKNGQNPEIAIKLDLQPSYIDDDSDIKTLQENGLLDPESDKGKLWLWGSRFIYDHFRKKFAATRTRKGLAGGAQGPLFTPEDLEGMTPIEKQLEAVNVHTRDYGPAFIQATTDIGKEGLTDEQIMQAGLDFIGMVEHSLFFGGATLAETEEMSSDTRRALAGMLHMYQEDLPPFSWSGTGRLFKGMFLDPPNYMGSLAGLQFVKQLLAGGAKTFGKHQLRDRLFKKLWGSTFIGVEGSAYAAMQDAYLQHLKGAGDPNFEFNKAQNLLAATTGLVAGTAFGGAVTNIPAIVKGVGAGVKALGRAADKMIGEPGLRSVVGGVPPIPKAPERITSAAPRVEHAVPTEVENPNSIINMLYNAPEGVPLAPVNAPRKRWSKAVLAKVLDKQARDSGRAVKSYDAKSLEQISDTIADETVAALNREGNASDWYNSKITEMNKTLLEIHPKLLPGSTREGIFKIGLAISSNGSAVDYNLKAADHLYSVFKKTGKFPTDLKSLEASIGGFGKEGPTLVKQMNRANDMIDEKGADKFVEFLNTEFTVKELGEMGFKLSGEPADYKTHGSAIFGPKIGGGFYQNLRGNFDPVTFDRWWMASWGRWTGSAELKTSKTARAQQLKIFREISGSEVKTDKALISQAKKIFTEYRKNNFQPRTELNKAAQRLAEGATIKMNEYPRGATQRTFMRATATRALEKLRALGYDIKPADLQATVWYPEKELHGKFKIGSGRSAPDDYAAAALRLLQDIKKAKPRIRVLDPKALK